MPVANLQVGPLSCPDNCHDRGVCNSRGHCHCDDGWAPPYCQFPGPGGSLDSGPASNPKGSSASTALYVIIFALLLLCLVLGVAAYVKRDRIQNYIKQSKQEEGFIKVERRRSSRPPSRLNIDTKDISGPISVETAQSLSSSPTHALLPRSTTQTSDIGPPPAYIEATNETQRPSFFSGGKFGLGSGFGYRKSDDKLDSPSESPPDSLTESRLGSIKSRSSSFIKSLNMNLSFPSRASMKKQNAENNKYEVKIEHSTTQPQQDASPIDGPETSQVDSTEAKASIAAEFLQNVSPTGLPVQPKPVLSVAGSKSFSSLGNNNRAKASTLPPSMSMSEVEVDKKLPAPVANKPVLDFKSNPKLAFPHSSSFTGQQPTELSPPSYSAVMRAKQSPFLRKASLDATKPQTTLTVSPFSQSAIPASSSAASALSTRGAGAKPVGNLAKHTIWSVMEKEKDNSKPSVPARSTEKSKSPEPTEPSKSGDKPKPPPGKPVIAAKPLEKAKAVAADKPKPVEKPVDKLKSKFEKPEIVKNDPKSKTAAEAKSSFNKTKAEKEAMEKKQVTDKIKSSAEKLKSKTDKSKHGKPKISSEKPKVTSEKPKVVIDKKKEKADKPEPVAEKSAEPEVRTSSDPVKEASDPSEQAVEVNEGKPPLPPSSLKASSPTISSKPTISRPIFQAATPNATSLIAKAPSTGVSQSSILSGKEADPMKPPREKGRRAVFCDPITLPSPTSPNAPPIIHQPNLPPSTDATVGKIITPTWSVQSTPAAEQAQVCHLAGKPEPDKAEEKEKSSFTKLISSVKRTPSMGVADRTATKEKKDKTSSLPRKPKGTRPDRTSLRNLEISSPVLQSEISQRIGLVPVCKSPDSDSSESRLSPPEQQDPPPRQPSPSSKRPAPKPPASPARADQNDDIKGKERFKQRWRSRKPEPASPELDTPKVSNSNDSLDTKKAEPATSSKFRRPASIATSQPVRPNAPPPKPPPTRLGSLEPSPEEFVVNHQPPAFIPRRSTTAPLAYIKEANASEPIYDTITEEGRSSIVSPEEEFDTPLGSPTLTKKSPDTLSTGSSAEEDLMKEILKEVHTRTEGESIYSSLIRKDKHRRKREKKE